MRRVPSPRRILLPPKSGIIALPPAHRLFADAPPKVKDALRFYELNYSILGQAFDLANTLVLRSALRPGICRFCDQSEPQVTFRDTAHALPECMGNKRLTTDYECDSCNHLFGNTIENDFGKWSKAQRALSGVRGKNGIPAMKGTHWRFEHDPTSGITVAQNEGEPIAVPNAAGTEITLTVPREPYTPVAVLKAFTKMAISLLPDEELPNFRRALAWIHNPDHEVGLVKVSGYPVFYTFVPGTSPLTNSAILLRRKTPNLPLPYMVFVLTYGNEVFQIFVPSPEKDPTSISMPRDKLYYFPNPYELDSSLVSVAPIQRELIDLTGRAPVKGEMVETLLRTQ